MFRNLVISTVIVLGVLAGCSKDENTNNPAGTPGLDSTIYQGTLYDTVLAAIFATAHITYTGSQYRYTLYTDGDFIVDENVGMGWTVSSGEEGSYVAAGSVRTFTPTIDRYSNAQHQMVPTDSLRPVYTGSISNDTLTITNFINIDNKANQRDLGTLVLKKQ